jgi:hypothetical protein
MERTVTPAPTERSRLQPKSEGRSQNSEVRSKDTESKSTDSADYADCTDSDSHHQDTKTPRFQTRKWLTTDRHGSPQMAETPGVGHDRENGDCTALSPTQALRGTVPAFAPARIPSPPAVSTSTSTSTSTSRRSRAPSPLRRPYGTTPVFAESHPKSERGTALAFATHAGSHRANHCGNPPADQAARGPARGLPSPLGRDFTDGSATRLPSHHGIGFADCKPRRRGFRGQIRGTGRVQNHGPNHPGNRSGNGSPCDSQRVGSDELDRA